MYKVTVKYADQVVTFACCPTMDRAVLMADSLKLEAWVTFQPTGEVVYTNR